MAANNRRYGYDPIGNRVWDRIGADPNADYAANNLNEYTDTPYADPNKLEYDEDGNLTGDQTYTFTWNAENRLIAVTPRSPAVNDKKLEFQYDHRGRRESETNSQ